MRYDMGKVLTERPRAHGHYARTPKGSRRLFAQQERDDELPKYESIDFCWKRGLFLKEFTDLIGPLYRFIRSRVGRKWNDVYSEIRERVNPSSLQQIHLLDHIDGTFGMVHTKVGLIDGEPYDFSGNGKIARITSARRYEVYYVCPVSGLLLIAPKEK